jgi:hypothetical protein
LRPNSLSLTAAIVSLLAAVAISLAQAPPPQAVSPPHEHEHEHIPTPTNLKVLPKNLTGDQVHEIMHSWSSALGVHCDQCHVTDPAHLDAHGHPTFKFADDSKPEKISARLMVQMVDSINKDYLPKLPAPKPPDTEPRGKVTCGTCHRGHLKPEKFVPPHDDHHPLQNPPQAAPPPH